MEDAWICIKEDDEVDSHNSASDSDMIDSETEAELYSTIHYEENLNSNNAENVNFLTSEMLVRDYSSPVLTTNKNIFCTVEKGENVNTQLMDKLMSVSNDLDCVEGNKISPNKNVFLNSQLKQDLSPAKKLKLNSIEEGQIVNSCSDSSKERDLKGSSKHTSINSTESEISSQSSLAKQSHLKKSTSLPNSSDSESSDSIIWAEKNSSEKADFKTNLLKDADTVFLNSSDSDSELHVSPSFKKKANLSMPNLKMGENCEGLWHINNEDLYRQRKYSRRYHENVDVKCSNCNEKGHSYRICPRPKKIKCFICGGDHLGSRCMNRICSNCYSYGHDRKRCRMGVNNFYCRLCCINGHTDANCPDLWRRYHLTTQPVNIVKGKRVKKQNTNLYCWNCGDRGHFGGLCNFRFSQRLTTWPCVVSYEDPGELLRKRLDDRKVDHIRKKERLRNRNFNSSKRKNAHLKQNEWNTAQDPTEGKTPSRKERKKKMHMQFKKVKKVLREHDFPRTPKQEISKQNINEEFPSAVPESVELSIKQQIKKKKRNLKRRWKRQQKELGGWPPNQEMLGNAAKSTS